MSAEEILAAHFKLGEQDALLSLRKALSASMIPEPICKETREARGISVYEADCYFSRMCSQETDEEEGSELCAVGIDQEVGELFVAYLDSAQMSAEEILAAHIELGEQDALLSLREALSASIPEPIHKELRAVHNALVGHSGVDRTLKRLREKHVEFQYMRPIGISLVCALRRQMRKKLANFARWA